MKLKLKPCPLCARHLMLVHLTCYLEPHMRDVVDMSVKCEACGYECKLGRMRGGIGPITIKTVTILLKAYATATEAWNKRASA